MTRMAVSVAVPVVASILCHLGLALLGIAWVVNVKNKFLVAPLLQEALQAADGFIVHGATPMAV